jgi:NTE family protein
MKGGQIEHLLDSMACAKGCANFDSLKIPFCCVAADIRSGEEVILRQGALAQAMRASMAIPGVFKPVDTGDYKLVDGGMLNNLPVDVCRQMGADIVIAVDLQQNDQKPRQQTDLSAISAIADLIGVGGILNWILNRPDIEKYITNKQQADILIRPYLPDYDVASFGNKIAARMIQSGADATRQLLPQIHALDK